MHKKPDGPKKSPQDLPMKNGNRKRLSYLLAGGIATGAFIGKEIHSIGYEDGYSQGFKDGTKQENNTDNLSKTAYIFPHENIENEQNAENLRERLFSMLDLKEVLNWKVRKMGLSEEAIDIFNTLTHQERNNLFNQLSNPVGFEMTEYIIRFEKEIDALHVIDQMPPEVKYPMFDRIKHEGKPPSEILSFKEQKEEIDKASYWDSRPNLYELDPPDVKIYKHHLDGSEPTIYYFGHGRVVYDFEDDDSPSK